MASLQRPRGGSTPLSLLLTPLLLILSITTVRGQFPDPAAACSYLEAVFSDCWTNPGLAYTAPPVADCVCTTANSPDPLVDLAVPRCTSYMLTAPPDPDITNPTAHITAFYSSYGSYCARYAGPEHLPGEIACSSVISMYAACQSAPDTPITDSIVASCICHDIRGQFVTTFDDLLTPCYSWAKTRGESSLASQVGGVLGYCTKYGALEFTTRYGDSTILPPTITPPPPEPTSISPEEDASSACEAVAKLAASCQTGPGDPLTREPVASCICRPGERELEVDGEGFGTTRFEEWLKRCLPYAQTVSSNVGSEISSLIAGEGYCARYGGVTETMTRTRDRNVTVTEDVWEGVPTQTDSGGAKLRGGDGLRLLWMVGVVAGVLGVLF